MAAEAYELSSQLGSQDGASNLSTKLLNFVHFYSSPALFIIFIVAFVTNSILSAENAAESLGPVRLGPGGKPLPRGTARKNEEEREKRKKDKDFSHGRKLFFFYLSAALLATFVANAINIIAHALTDTANGWWCGEAAAIYVCASAFFYSIFLISLVDTTPSPNIAHQITWGFSIIMEVVLLGGNIALYTSPHKEINSLKKKDDSEKIYDSPTDWEAVQLTIDIARVIVLLALFTFYIIFSLERSHNQRSESRGDSDEQAPLLVNGQANGNGHVHDNGTIGHGECAAGFVTPNTRKSTEEPAFYKPTVQPNKTCLVASPTNSPIEMERPLGTGGILGAIRSVLWIPISQYSYRALTTASFEHVHSLSLDFHLGKRTGEVLSALSKGNAINNFLEQITFQVLPMIFDLGVAIVYFGIAFDAYYALVVAMITFAYLYLTIRMARWRSTQRRAMTNLSREEDAVKNDSLTSYETVKYFNAEEYEFNRYRKAVIAFQAMEYEVTISLNILNISQNMVFMTGLLVTSFISAYQVTTGIRKAGDFVTLLTYMAQLQQPLNFFGSFYRSVQSAMISGERLLELFKEQPTVVDELEAKAMPGCEGQISFQNVKFSYDQRKPALENLSFNCRPGTTTAFVGESGGGKSTVFRLLFRFYNTQDGSIQVDGTDVRDITIDSLRRHIGVVPQDTILFNETLMYNLKYANQAATDEQVYAACRAASIHDKIMAFPDQYETKVGERGLRLSGGEKQRVAIARTILKDPRIIMLDEATAALDSDTEQNIQEALRTLSQGRTMLVIAHRLSTITSADQIVVLHAGRVDEAGTHKELLEKKGRYYNMWRKQIKAERAEQQATQMMAKAKALKDAIMTRPTSSGNEGSPSEEASDNDCGRDNRSTTTSATLASNALLVKKPEAYRMDSSSGSESNFGDVNGINGTKPDSVDKFQGVETAGETLVGATAQGAQNDARQAEQEQPRQTDPSNKLRIS
ncbi:uncharacterized protein L3040_004252 [Drepanopeziza brunnea f. sp. 'multigermtubi']|uniref:uncharacterized protein n=1 Tax=Drepanopeziza brunnea f. sp. 'multigermtubi' TaxID=698441 RepID=UPI002383EE3B|nr:hypothetical protein L3040_004252 [Drepanopeziza brunnea f. sp. 'multigermtubi']